MATKEHPCYAFGLWDSKEDLTNGIIYKRLPESLGDHAYFGEVMAWGEIIKQGENHLAEHVQVTRFYATSEQYQNEAKEISRSLDIPYAGALDEETKLDFIRLSLAKDHMKLDMISFAMLIVLIIVLFKMS